MNINKWISFTIFEIIFLLTIIISTNILWDSLDLEEEANIAYSYTHNTSMLTTDIESHLTPLVPINDWQITENNKITINVNNSSNENKKYNLYLIINKKSELNINYLKSSIENEKKYLNDLNKTIKGNSTYYLLKTDIVKEKNTHDLYLWLDHETPNKEEGKNLSFQILAEEI